MVRATRLSLRSSGVMLLSLRPHIATAQGDLMFSYCEPVKRTGSWRKRPPGTRRAHHDSEGVNFGRSIAFLHLLNLAGRQRFYTK